MKNYRKRKDDAISHLYKQTWFKKAGWFYLPVHAMGILVTLAMIVFVVAVCMSLIRSHNAITSDLYKIFIAASCAGFWWKWIAEKTSER
jgi:hypothetical protein